MIEIDGSMGEGGGQVLRSSLSLSVLTGQPVHLTRVRAGRAKPGLQPQHLMAVKAIAAVSSAEVEGAWLHSQELTFRPGAVKPGEYRFDIGTAGATSLVVQTVFLPLALARPHPSTPSLRDSAQDARGLPGTAQDATRSTGSAQDATRSAGSTQDARGLPGTAQDARGLPGTAQDARGSAGSAQDATRSAGTAQDASASRDQHPERSAAESKDSTSEVTVIGGTHVPHSPCYHYLALDWLPLVRQAGYDADLEMLLAGFYPQGGGEVRLTVRPVERISPLLLPERGALKRITGISAVANLDTSIAERQRKTAFDRLKARHGKIDVEIEELPARTKGTMLLLLAEFRHTSVCYFSLGALGKRAEQVADEACLWLEKFLSGTGAVDEYAADQLLLPLAFAEGESRFRTALVTEHLRTNAEVIRAFGAADVTIEKDGREGTVRVRPRGVAPQ